MSRLLEATMAISSVPSSLTEAYGQSGEETWRVVDVFCLGSQCAWFVVKNGSHLSSNNVTSRIDKHILFPEKGMSQDGTKEDFFLLLRELQRVASVVSVDGNDAARRRGDCLRCPGKREGIAAVSTLYVQGLHVVLFFVMECHCMAIASFVIDPPVEANDGGSSKGKAQLLAVRWCSGDMKENESSHYMFPRQLSVPMSAIVEEYKSDSFSLNSTSFLSSSSSLPGLQQGQRYPKRVSASLSRNTFPWFILRIVFARVMGWVEYVDFVWQEYLGRNVSSPWRTLQGFRQFTWGSLQLEKLSGVPGEVRALRWMPFSRDYEGRYPLLAVLYQKAPVSGDPFLDCLAVSMLSVLRRRQQQQIPMCVENDSWVGLRETLHGSLMEGPWCLEALTLAHPSFLLHAVLPGGGNMEGGHDALGVFLRPAYVMYPMSTFLRDEKVYASWEPLVATAARDNKKSEEMYFAVFTEDGEVTRCQVGGFIESAVACPVTSSEPRRVSSAAGGTERVVAVVLAMRSGGDVLLLEVWNTTNVAAAAAGGGVGVGVGRSILEQKNASGDAKMAVVNCRNIPSWDAGVPRSLRHLHRLIGLKWEDARGTVFLLAAHEDENTQQVDCSLLMAELVPQGGDMPRFIWFGASNGFIVDGGSNSHGFPLNVGLPALVQPLSRVDGEYNLGSLQHAPLHPLCRCTVRQNEAVDAYEREVVIFRSGDICLVRRNTPFSTHWRNYDPNVFCKRLSRVQWPHSGKTAEVDALFLLFASGSSDISMESFWTTTGGKLPTPVEIDGGPISLHELQLLLVCRATVILMTAEGQVVCVSDVHPPLAVMNDGDSRGLVGTETMGSIDGERFSLLSCMIRFFASFQRNHFFICATSASSLPSRENGCRECFFLFLQVTCSGEQQDDSTLPLATVCVVDIIHVKTDVHPLFDFLPTGRLDDCAKMTALGEATRMGETCVFARDMMYCAGAKLYTVPCVLRCRASTRGVWMEGKFETPSSNSHHVVLDLKDLLHEGNKATIWLLEPSLLQCVPLPSKRERGRMCVVVVLSFVSGPTLAAAVHCSSVSRRRWESQLLVEGKGTTEEMAVPFVRLVTQPATCGECDPICWLQDAVGCWHSLVYRDTGDPRRDSCDVQPSLSFCVDDMQKATQGKLESSSSHSGENGFVEESVMCGGIGIFSLGPRC
ncbi:hypothetical protein C3747_22g321 [Trypanosoma cruzi]|uniref:Uncharacterized protein n=2 Tax=Trypanosoma cruzi TaxID=5693 RepID=Q4DVG9_TRYCC|nr:hypothetical protein, conserved [Trypanosoma cruzi]EAN96522.1 hypothetical protein, conserved [Trypanosoma cruzi]PWV16596.1 hypothetical protein C3747_22g321 [Trypanosoma cruzi]RNC57721.1 hypothetical protein TcCL_ESM04680 [Trypanosoma cruzi]|eukprot:XP_818373.1 hypothetical protein [Trypanosoma cruzi strain CL Brener]